MRRRTRNPERNGERGQAAVETVFAIPVLLVLFLIGFELFAITWNAQFVHVESRYKAIKEADHQACKTGDHSFPSTIREDSRAQVPGDKRMWQRSTGAPHQLRQRAVIVCQ